MSFPDQPKKLCSGIQFTRKRTQIALMFLLFLIALSAALIGNGRRSLWDTSETRYAEASREIVTSGNWLVPQISGQPHLTKPPLTYWLIAISMKFFGFSEGAVRFPIALAFALTVISVAALGWTMSSSFSKGIIAGCLYLVSPLPFLGGHVVTTDTLVSLWVVLYMLCFWNATLSPGAKQNTRSHLFMHLFLGLAFLTKGPPAFLPALAVVSYLVATRQFHALKRLASGWGILVFLLIAIPWYIIVLLKVPHAIQVWKLEALHKVFVESDRDMPAIYYPLILIGGTFPSMMIISWGWFRKGFRCGINQAIVGRNCAVPFLGFWLILPTIVFMLSRTRMTLYVLPLAPAASLLASFVMPSIYRRRTHRIMGVIYMTFQILVLISTKFYIAHRGDPSKDMKPVAMAIAADAIRLHLHPSLVVSQERMGNGLLYYLQGPPLHRIVKDPLNPKSKSHLMTEALSQPLSAEHARYVIIDNSDSDKIVNRFGSSLKSIYTNGQWEVFRQETQVPGSVL